MSRGLRVLLAVSLAVNLLVAGIVIGAWWRGGPSGPDRGGAVWGGSQAVLFRALPQEMRREMRRDALRRIDRDLLGGLRLAPELDTALRAEPFDAAAVEALLLRHAMAVQDGHAALRAIWLDKVQRMTQAERALYADRVAEALRERRGQP